MRNFIQMRKVIVVLLIVGTLPGSCFKKDINTTTCDYDPCAVKAPANEITQLETYLSGAGITTAIKHCSGMYCQIITQGADKTPTVCSYISVYFRGSLANGKVFDSTVANTPYTNAPLALLISGWQNGILLIKKGGKIRLYIPPSLGYGAKDKLDNSGAVTIPANSILIFDIELLDVQ